MTLIPLGPIIAFSGSKTEIVYVTKTDSSSKVHFEYDFYLHIVRPFKS